ncbi:MULTISPECIES: Uma2 family endonuclease [unclassified Streptomyces]|uniref:Uma2 family endonuclease n=1 Tax=unclassified Streptomyces TaxID=2593676 RepID=UPI002E13176C|nr:Uma2 family endonuclease [Streptomyces sp. NBC_01197]WSS50635.1 Uma2 family endonuclease [Streptomyces sp. NBC_01180]
MTVMAERTSQITVEEFEKIAKFSATESDAVRLEFIDGRIGDSGVPDGDHNEIWMWLQGICMQHRPELGLYGGDQGLKVESYRNGRARPDGSLAPRGNFAGQGEWADPDGVLMTVEITSYDRDTDRRDRKEKPVAYAGAGIPVYLLVDREAGAVTVFSAPDPEGGGYRDSHTVKFGEVLMLPDPVGIELDTEVLQNYVR